MKNSADGLMNFAGLLFAVVVLAASAGWIGMVLSSSLPWYAQWMLLAVPMFVWAVLLAAAAGRKS